MDSNMLVFGWDGGGLSWVFCVILAVGWVAVVVLSLVWNLFVGQVVFDVVLERFGGFWCVSCQLSNVTLV